MNSNNHEQSFIRMSRDLSSSFIRDKSPNLNESKLEEENNSIKKQLRLKEAEIVKVKAVLEQKIELLTLQLQEANEREESLKKVQDKMFSAFSSNKQEINPDQVKELQITNQLYQNEIKDLKEHHQQLIDSYERQLSETKSTLDIQLRQIQQKEVDLKLSQEDNFKLQSEIIELKMKQSHVESVEKKKSARSNSISQRGKEERIRLATIENIQSLKLAHEKERLQWEQKVTHLEQSIKSSTSKDKNSLCISDMQSKYLKEIQDLNQSLAQFKKQTEEDLLYSKKEKEEALKKCQLLEKDLLYTKQKLKKLQDEMIKNLKSKNQDKQSELDERDKLLQENEKLKKNVVLYKSQIAKYEIQEKKLRTLLIEKDHDYEHQITDIRKQLSLEKKKVKELQHSIEERIKEKNELSKTVSELKQLDYSPFAHKETDSLTVEAQQSIILATKILEMGQEITCGQCSLQFSIQQFVKHIQQSQCALMQTTSAFDLSEIQKQLNSNDLDKKSYDTKFSCAQFSSCNEIPSEYHDNKYQNVDQIQYLEQQDQLIQVLSQQLEQLKEEKQYLQQDYEKLQLQLKRTQIELQLAEERRQESEQCYKNEIKYLIDKLLKAKSKLSKERSCENTSFISSISSTKNYLNNLKQTLDLSMEFRQGRNNNNSTLQKVNSTSKLFKNQPLAQTNHRSKILLELEQNAMQHNRSQILDDKSRK